MADKYTKMDIAPLVRSAEEKLRRLKAETMSYTHVDSTGALVVDTSNPDYQVIQAEISELETKLARVSELADIAMGILSANGVDTIGELHSNARLHNDNIQSLPIVALNALKRMREVAIFNKREGVATAMPSELPGLLPEYATEEARLKSLVTQAQADLPGLRAGIAAFVDAAEEARALLR